MSITKKELSLLLSKLSSFSQRKANLEQYQTPSEIAADACWMAFLSDDLAGKIVADLGCGNGILGCGALALGAHHVFFVDLDDSALRLAESNVLFLEKNLGTPFSRSFLHQDAGSFLRNVDSILQNPPFGVQRKHADRPFLASALRAHVAYSFHKLETREFVESFASQRHRTARLLKTYSFPLPRSMTFHKKRVYRVDVGLWRISK